jgi:hypothetical protein
MMGLENMTISKWCANDDHASRNNHPVNTDMGDERMKGSSCDGQWCATCYLRERCEAEEDGRKTK